MKNLIFSFILTLIVTLCTITTYAQPAQYTPMTASGYQMKRLKVDSTLHLPSFCGVPTLRGTTSKDGALAIDTCGGYLYMWTNQSGWDTINISGGGGSGGNQDLQSVLDIGNTSLNKDLVLYGRTTGNILYLSALDNSWMPFMALGDSIGGGLYQYTYPQATIEFINKFMNQRLKQQDSIRGTIYLPSQISDATDTLAKLSDVRAMSGGGATDTTSLSNRINLKLNIADTASMLTPYLRKIDTTNKFVNTITRTEGKDSIIYFVGANRFAIKDSVGTNPAPVGYYGAFQDTLTQTAASINTAYPVNLRVTDLSNGITIANNSKIKIANAGIYNIQFSLQLEKTGGSGNMIADIWLRKNGVNIDGTTGKVVLTGSANASPIVAAWNYVVAVSSNDSLELMWSTSNDNVVIKAAPATSPHPSIPSAILTVTQQSGIMAGTGISPLDTANMLLPYLRKIDTTSLSNRINLKLNIADTSALQRKSIPAYSILANPTNATANVTAQQFRDTSGTYSGTITWTGTTAPSGATNHSYRLTQVGKCVTLHIALVFATNGAGLTAVQMTLPAGAPTPVQPAGLSGSIFNMYPVTSQIVNSLNQSILSGSARGFVRNNVAANGFEIFITFVTSGVGQVGVTAQYWTN